MASHEIAWAAGLFEGEGCISVHPSKRHVSLQLGSKDLDVLEEFQRIVGCGSIYPMRTQNGMNQWVLGRAALVVALLEKLYPYFGQRRTSKADEALALLLSPRPPRRGPFSFPCAIDCQCGRHTRSGNRQPRSPRNV